MSDSGTYTLLDCGSGRKLEQVGSIRIERQAPLALWKASLPTAEWKKAEALHVRSQSGGGHWTYPSKSKVPESWMIIWGGLRLKVKLTAFGHLGFFAEQANEWRWLKEQVSKHKKVRVLNLFGYTGGSSLSMALAGAEVTHVDAAKGIVDWGRENAALNAVPDGRIRWIVDDCLKFVRREERRGNKYDAVVLDPPSYGRGPDGQVFKIEDDIGNLLKALKGVLVDEPLFVHFSSHSPGFSPQLIWNLVKLELGLSNDYHFEGVEMTVPCQEQALALPAGVACRLDLMRRAV